MSLDIEKIRERFSGDLYATELSGITAEEAGEGHSVCRMEIQRKHQNAMGGVMGGAIFTLCDFAYAVASNGLDKPYTMTLSSSVSFLSQPKGKVLTATADCVKDGKRTCCYNVTVTDEAGNVIATALFNGYKLDTKK